MQETIAAGVLSSSMTSCAGTTRLLAGPSSGVALTTCRASSRQVRDNDNSFIHLGDDKAVMQCTGTIRVSAKIFYILQTITVSSELLSIRVGTTAMTAVTPRFANVFITV